MEFGLLLLASILVGTFIKFLMTNSKIDKKEEPTPPSVSDVINKRTKQITPEMLYEWKKEGENTLLIFKQTEAALNWKYGFTCQKIKGDSKIKKGEKIPIISVQSAWAQLIGVKIPQPEANVEGVICLSSKWREFPLTIEDNEVLLTIKPEKEEYDSKEKAAEKIGEKIDFDKVTAEMLYSWEEREDELRLIFTPSTEMQKFSIFCINYNYTYSHIIPDYNFGIFDFSHSDNDCSLREFYSLYIEHNKRSYTLPCAFNQYNGVVVYNTESLSKQITQLNKGMHLLTLYVGDKAERLRKQRVEKVRLKEEKEAKDKMRQRLLARQKRKELEKQVRQELIDNGELFGEQHKRPHIPREVVDAVYRRDGGKCVYCGSTDNLHLDHIIPFSRGGATNIENLQVLCQKCNLEKSNKIG